MARFNLSRKNGSGDTVMFWEENWLGNFNLCSEFEDLYRIAADCNITVADKSITEVQGFVGIGSGFGNRTIAS